MLIDYKIDDKSGFDRIGTFGISTGRTETKEYWAVAGLGWFYGCVFKFGTKYLAYYGPDEQYDEGLELSWFETKESDSFKEAVELLAKSSGETIVWMSEPYDVIKQKVSVSMP